MWIINVLVHHTELKITPTGTDNNPPFDGCKSIETLLLNRAKLIKTSGKNTLKTLRTEMSEVEEMTGSAVTDEIMERF